MSEGHTASIFRVEEQDKHVAGKNSSTLKFGGNMFLSSLGGLLPEYSS
jgi:hypothetical protein